MQTARRLYVYLIAGVSLGVLVVGAASLVGIGLEQLGLSATDAGRDPVGERLTQAAAFVAVGLPVWLIHWFLAERSVRPDQADAAVERSSTVRGLFIALVLGALLWWAASGLATAIRVAVIEVGSSEPVFESLAGGLAQFVVGAVAWLYHGWIRQRDWARGPMTGGGAALPRAYLYLAAFGGLLTLLNGAAELLDVAWRTYLRAPELPVVVPWDLFPLGNELANVIVGGGIWLGHSIHAERIVRDPGWRGDSERPARLRQAYVVAVVVATLAFAMYHLADAISATLRTVAGVPTGADELPGAIVVPLLAAIPFALVAWLHARRPGAEARASGSAERIQTAARLGLYSISLVGLGFAAVELARLGGSVIRGVAGTPSEGGGAWLVTALTNRLPGIVLGAIVLWWAWRGINARMAADPAGESASTVRRATILVALAASVLAGIGSAAIVLYRLFGGLFGVEQPGDAVAELATPLATLVVAAVVGAVHALLLRSDDALRPAASAPGAVERKTVNLRVSGPADGDVLGALERVRAGLPPGYEIEVLGESKVE